jgi:hypothetical protein
MEAQVTFPALFVAIQHSEIKLESTTQRDNDAPVKHTEARHHPLLSTDVPTRWKLHGERDFGIVSAMDRKTPPAIPMRSAILEFGAKFNDLCEVLVAIFVLYDVLAMGIIEINYRARLSILPRNLNIVKLSMLEFSKIMTEKVQRLKSGPRVQVTLISIAPALESTNIFRERKFALEKFIFVLFL